MNQTLQLEMIVSPPFAENTYIVYTSNGGDCFIVDPGFTPDEIERRITDLKLHVVAILNTHGHVDHIAGNAAMKDRYPQAPLIIGAGDAPMLTDAVLNLSGHPQVNPGGMLGPPVVSPPADRCIEHGETLDLLGFEWEVRNAPGHSPGHVVFVLHASQPPIVIGGDVLFAGSVGRFDFPGCDGRLLLKSIRDQLYSLPRETVVYPGHGESTTVGQEMETNPFARPSDADE